MADFAQSAASRSAMKDAARGYLRGTGLSERSVQRYIAFLTGSGAQARNPARSFAKLPAIRVDIVADYAVADDPDYLREGKHMAWTLTQVETQQFLKDALSQPDEAWQDFFEAYSLPSGTAENANILLR